jgi:Ca-activated chloride channel family protein
LAIGIMLLIAETFFPERKPIKRRDSKDQAPRAGARTEVGASAATVAVVIALLVLPAVVASASPSSAMRDYKAGKFVEAQKEFERLAEADKTGDARFIFNAGDAAYRATNYDDALKFYTAALNSQDVRMQQKAYFNIGNTQYRQGEGEKDLDGVQQQWEQAIKSYQNAVALDKNDTNAIYNLEYTKSSVTMIEQMREAARRAKLEADNSVRQRQYHRALEILDQAVQHNVAAKQFQDYVKKLKDIDAIATPNQH